MQATFLGTSASAGRALDAVQGELARPEGVRRYLIAVPDDAPATSTIAPAAGNAVPA
jgi:hypothetical protein